MEKSVNEFLKGYDAKFSKMFLDSMDSELELTSIHSVGDTYWANYTDKAKNENICIMKYLSKKDSDEKRCFITIGSIDNAKYELEIDDYMDGKKLVVEFKVHNSDLEVEIDIESYSIKITKRSYTPREFTDCIKNDDTKLYMYDDPSVKIDNCSADGILEIIYNSFQKAIEMEKLDASNQVIAYELFNRTVPVIKSAINNIFLVGWKEFLQKKYTEINDKIQELDSNFLDYTENYSNNRANYVLKLKEFEKKVREVPVFEETSNHTNRKSF